MPRIGGELSVAALKASSEKVQSRGATVKFNGKTFFYIYIKTSGTHVESVTCCR